MPHTIRFKVSDEILAALRLDPLGFAAELRLAAAAKLYELGRVSQGHAAELAGLSRADFLRVLSRFQVSPFQDTTDTLRDELQRARRPRADE